jgi:uncharacterized protein YecE (DUF72 family)
VYNGVNVDLGRVEPYGASMAPIFLGTSSWTFAGWRGVFYPDALPQRDALAYYARHFPTVEVNASFYALPAPSTLVRWVEQTPPGFRFALKFPRQISHEKRLAASDAETLAFLDVLRALGPAAGPALLQLPPGLSRATYGRVLASYLDWLAPLVAGLPVAVEVRAHDLMTAAFAQFLAERGLVLALVDRAGTPDLYEIWRSAAPDAAFAYIRWIGDERHGPKGDQAITAPREADLERWAQRLVELVQAGSAVYGYMHNPYEGHSPASVARLQARLAGRVELPPWPPLVDDKPVVQMPLL